MHICNELRFSFKLIKTVRDRVFCGGFSGRKTYYKIWRNNELKFILKSVEYR